VDGLQLAVVGTNRSSVLRVGPTGSTRAELAGLHVTESLSAIEAEAVHLTGRLALDGPVGSVRLASLDGAFAEVESAGRIEILNAVDSSTLRAVHRVERLTVGALWDSNVLVGVADPVLGRVDSADDWTDAPGRLGRFTVAGLDGVEADRRLVVNSNISARSLETADLVALETANEGGEFGIFVDEPGGLVIRHEDPSNPDAGFTWNLAGDPADRQAGDFVTRIL
jgi:hypothetical protein